MKKNEPIGGLAFHSLKKTLLIMRIAVILLLVGFLQTRANDVYSQKTRLTIDFSDTELVTVLDKIENLSEFYFLYNEKLIDANRKVTIDAKDEKIEEVLKTLFSGTDVEYSILDRKIILAPSYMSAEQQTGKKVTGKVTDKSGASLPGVTVVVKGTTIGVITDANGNYSISDLPANANLQFSFVGMKAKEVVVGNMIAINVTLEEETVGIEEVVAIGYATQKKVNITGSISSVNMKELETMPITNSTQALQGISGLYVNQAGGQPGRDLATIQVRGQGTLNNNNALVLVNGIEYPLSDVNPEDIESISVLKDAASAAIYGSRAANGVILVTTKSGKGKFKVNYNAYYGVQVVNYLPDIVKDPIQFMELRNKAQINGGMLIVDYPQSLIDEYKAGMKTDPYTYPNNDWFNIMFSHSPIQEHNLQFSGETEKATYALSLGYLDQEGVMMGSSSNRYSMGFNTKIRISKKLTIGSIINSSYRNIDEPVAGVNNLMDMIFKAQAFHPTYLADGRYADTFVRTSGHNKFRHPIVNAIEGKNHTTEQRYLVNLFAEYELPFSIKYKVNFGLNKADNLNTVFNPAIYMYQNKTNAALLVVMNGDAGANPTSLNNRGMRRTNSSELNTTIFNTLNWEHSFNKIHNISILLGESSEFSGYNTFWAQNEGYLGNDLYELNAGSSNQSVFGTSSSSRLNSYFGRAGYNYEEKYLLEANFRYDGSSRFARNKRWGLFPSFSAGWRINQEKWLADISWLSNLKLRASWGQLGNERIGLFRYLNLLNLSQDYSFGNNVTSGAAITAYNDPTITWETTTMSNLGLDAGILKNRLNLVFDVFKKRTTNILHTVNIPSQVGNLVGPIRNIGTVDNNGFELGLNYQNSLGNLTYQINGSVTKIKNNVVNLNGETIYNGNSTIIKEGSPINSFYLIHAIGIFQTQEEINNSPFQTAATHPGDIKYQDTNGDGFITEDDRVISGGVIPEYTYQFSLNLGYKGFEVNAFFQGVQNINTYSSLIGAQPFWFGTSVTKEWITDAWTPENPNARLPILTTFETKVNENFRRSDFWLRDASYLRLKNLMVSYTLPNKITGKYGVSNLKLYVNGQNFLTFSKMKDFDPEKNVGGVNFYEYPTIKMFTTGINLTF